MNPLTNIRGSRAAIALSVLLATLTIFPAPTSAAPRTPRFGMAIDDYPDYQGARRCDPSPKPGVVAFQRLVLAAYPGTGAGSISRSCSGEATSEHNEGRAWDWGVNASNASDKRKADALIDWLLREDRYGNRHAMARRLGVMYIIWNRRIWGTWGGWERYCVQRRGRCVDPDDGGERHPHTDHVHFSFSWDGARKKTTFWHPKRSEIVGIESSPRGGYWLLGRNGGVYPNGTSYYGSLADRYSQRSYVAMASSPSGGGYWIARADGRVKKFGDALRRRDARDANATVAGMATTPKGRGYWLVTKRGRVLPYGDAKPFGDTRKLKTTVAGIAATPTGRGYWIATANGRVAAFGDAQAFGQPKGKARIVGIAPTASGLGYWVAAENGRVYAFGDASIEGGAVDKGLSSPVTGIAATPSGNGYWIVLATGRVLHYGT
ncbi:MAG: hypothetical protein ACRDKT_10815 [Actinomycetota bacterium]